MKHKGEIMMFQKNLAQEEAVQTHNGPVLLVSCPGSGKTTTMLRRINSMITSGIQASSIVMVTFTDAAAQEMKARYIKEYESDGRSMLAANELFYDFHKFLSSILSSIPM